MRRAGLATQIKSASEVPVLDIDAYGDEALRNPGPFLDAVRETAPVVYLKPNETYAIGRYAEAEIVTKDWQTYTSSHGMGLLDITKPGLLRPANEMLESDPPQHSALRKIMQRIMSPSTVRSFQGMFAERADLLVDNLLQKGEVDGASEIAQAFILDIFPKVIGIDLPPEPAIAVSTMMLNLMGPVNKVSQAAIAAAEPHLEWFNGATLRTGCVAEGLAGMTYQAEEDGLLPPGIGQNMAITFVAGGFDSTLAGIANTLLLLAKNPEQWAKVSADPSLVGAAFEEAIRLEPSFRAYYRMTTRDTELSGYKLAANTKIGIWMGAVNRDPRRFDRPDEYDVTRKGAGAAMGFGTGIHNCIGQILARVEAGAILTALAKRVSKLEIAGEITYDLHNQVRMPSRLPLTLTPN